MSLKRNFIIIVVIMLVFGCIDTVIVGGIFVHKPTIIKQTLHFVLLFSSMFLGYYFWTKYEQKWQRNLWLFSYFVILLLLLILVVEWTFKLPMNEYFTNTVINLRTTFIMPLPFIVFYLLNLVTEKRF